MQQDYPHDGSRHEGARGKVSERSDVPKIRPPSVTRVLRAQGFYSRRGLPDQFYLDRGRASHLAFELDDKGVLDESTLDERLLPFLAAHRKARVELELRDLRPPILEEYIISWPLGFAGKVDAVKWVCGWRTTLDWKNGGTEEAATYVQVSAYRLLVAHHLGLPAENLRGASLNYMDDGTYKFHWYEEDQLDEGWHRFASALDTYQWRATRSRLPTGDD